MQECFCCKVFDEIKEEYHRGNDDVREKYYQRNDMREEYNQRNYDEREEYNRRNDDAREEYNRRNSAARDEYNQRNDDVREEYYRRGDPNCQSSFQPKSFQYDSYQSTSRACDRPDVTNHPYSNQPGDSTNQQYGRFGGNSHQGRPFVNTNDRGYRGSHSNETFDKQLCDFSNEEYAESGVSNQKYNKPFSDSMISRFAGPGDSNIQGFDKSNVPRQEYENRFDVSMNRGYIQHPADTYRERYDRPPGAPMHHDRSDVSCKEERRHFLNNSECDDGPGNSTGNRLMFDRFEVPTMPPGQSYRDQPPSQVGRGFMNNEAECSDEEGISDDGDDSDNDDEVGGIKRHSAYHQDIINEILFKSQEANIHEFRKKVKYFKIEIHGLPTDKVSKELVVENLALMKYKVTRIGFMFGPCKEKNYYFLTLLPEPDSISIFNITNLCGYPVFITESSYKTNPNTPYFQFYRVKRNKRNVLTIKNFQNSIISPTDPSNPKHAYVDDMLNKIQFFGKNPNGFKNAVKRFKVTVTHNIPEYAAIKDKVKAALRQDKIYLKTFSKKTKNKFTLLLKAKPDVIKILKVDKLFGYVVDIQEVDDVNRAYHKFFSQDI